MRDGPDERERLKQFLLELADGQHAAVLCEGLPFDEAFQLCRRVATSLNERIVRSGGPGAELVFASADRATLAALARKARAEGQRGVLVAVNGEESISSRGARAHKDAERAVGATPLRGVRVVCFYARLVGDDACLGEHATAFGVEASAKP